MFKRCLSVILAGLLLFGVNTSFIFAQTKADDNKAANVEKVKASVAKRGTSEKNQIRVKMLNGTKLKGYISQISDDSFTLTDSKTKQPTVIAYSNAARVEGRGMSGGVRIGIIAFAAVIGAAIILFFIARDSIRDSL